ncbi:MAG: hypothetical protein ACTSUE_15880 [Promethearchaeota archaeon]
MTGSINFKALEDLLDVLHGRLFPKNYEFVSWEELRDCLMEVNQLTNKVLKDYHEIKEPEGKMVMKPTLQFIQDLMSRMARLLKFEPESLTKFNQILVDLKKMLEDKDELIKTTYTLKSQAELDLLADTEFRDMLEKFVEHFMRTAPDDL